MIHNLFVTVTICGEFVLVGSKVISGVGVIAMVGIGD